MATPVESIAAFLLTYALHSTLLIGLVWVWMRVRAPRSARLREVLWAFALCGGVISAAAQHGGIVAPHTLTLEWTRSAPQDPVARTVERTSAARRAADVPAAAPGPSVAPSKSIGERVTELAVHPRHEFGSVDPHADRLPQPWCARAGRAVCAWRRKCLRTAPIGRTDR